MITLRDYQEETLCMLDSWWAQHDGNPCIVAPTGSGKSILIAAFCQRTLALWPETRIMIICSQKELVEQDADKLLAIWPEAPLGVCCAATGRRELGRRITIGSILSVFRRDEAETGVMDLIIVDEAHLISHRDEGSYRTLIDRQKAANPKLRVIGLTATPYRLGHGYITDGDALFSAPLIQPAGILELQRKGYLSPLSSKTTKARLSTEGVAVRGGEYVERELQAKVDDRLTSEQVVSETISRAGDRKHWLVFCCGVEHAMHVRDILISEGVDAGCVTGKTGKAEREDILARFKAGEITALTNANVLTTGFDFPGIDLIVMMRPTMSPGLYVQMAGRGLRTAQGKKDCLVLDFAGNVQQHGPITAVNPPRRKGQRQGVAPAKICPQCDEIIPASALVCPECGFAFPRNAQTFGLHDDDIMGLSPMEMQVSSWQWTMATARNGRRMLACRFYSASLSRQPLTRFYCLWHDGLAAQLALESLCRVAGHAGVDLSEHATPEDLCEAFDGARPPARIQYRRSGKYYDVINQIWD